MKYRLFEDTYVVRLEKGEELVSSLSRLCKDENVVLATIEGLGACNRVVLGLYDIDLKQYHRKQFDGAYEITSIIGNITRKDDEPYLHIHMNVADENMCTYGGHLYECNISATCELFIRVIDGRVDRKHDEISGLNLFDFT